MTIEISNPELEAIIRQRLEAGNFSTVEDMLLRTLGGPIHPLQETSRREAVRRMQEFGDKYQLSLGEPVTRHMLHEGHRV